MREKISKTSGQQEQHDVALPSSGRILFVDDEENILRALRRLFVDENYDVLIANSGEKGLELLAREENVGLIVSDQRMPKMTGVEFLEQSKELAPDAIRILLTGYADVGAAVDAINLGGAARYISKPWRDEELLQIARECMQRYFLVRENQRLQGIIRQKNEELKKWNDELQIYVQEQTMELQDNYNELKKLNFRLRANFKDFVDALTSLLEMRDKGMRSHARNVAKLAGQAAKAVQLGAEQVEIVIVAALLHDIGKIGIPEAILLADRRNLDPDEQRQYEMHAIRGQEVLSGLADLRKHSIIIRHHHERYDGQGYPDGLKGEEIPLPARLIAIADFIDTEVRQVESDNALAEVMELMQKEVGARFAPGLVHLFDGPARELYGKSFPKRDFVKLELLPKDLRVGMILDRHVTSSTGLLLLSKGTELTKTNIDLLHRYYELDTFKSPITVWCKR